MWEARSPSEDVTDQLVSLGVWFSVSEAGCGWRWWREQDPYWQMQPVFQTAASFMHIILFAFCFCMQVAMAVAGAGGVRRTPTGR
jgi:cytochrome b561